MARYGLIWLEIAREQYLAHDDDIRELIDARIERLLEAPRRQPPSSYDRTTDQWTVTYGNGTGLIVYAIVAERRRLIVLRLVCADRRETRSVARDRREAPDETTRLERLVEPVVDAVVAPPDHRGSLPNRARGSAVAVRDAIALVVGGIDDRRMARWTT